MKRIKKLASILLAMVMVLGMTMTTFAANAGDGSQIPDPDAKQPVKHVYEIYQIFIGDVDESGTVLSNIKWGGNSMHRTGEAVDEDVLKELEEIAKSTSDTEKLAVIEKYANLDSTPMQEGIGTSYTDLTPGYYLVKDQDNSLTGTNEPYTLYVVQVVNGTLNFTPKGDIPTPDKKIVEGDNKVDVNEASIGDDVNYEITGTMPSNIADYNEYYYVFTDTLSKGLTFDPESVVVTVDEVDVTKYFHISATEYDKEAGTTITIGIQDILALKNIQERIRIDFTKDTNVVVTYTARLNEDAVIGTAGNPNDVILDYSNDPNNSGSGSTTPPPENPDKPEPTHPIGTSPKKEVTTYTTELTILKTNEEGAFLPGVEFTLTGNGVNVVLVTEETFTQATDGEYWKLKDGTYTTTAPTVADDETDNTADYDDATTKYKKETTVVAKGNGKPETNVVGTVQADGTVTFKGLGAGEYTLTESKPLDGYNTIEPIVFEVIFTGREFITDNEVIEIGANNTLETLIVNQKGSLLPSTGGIGTTIFYVVGAVLVIGAGILLVTKKRMSAR